MGMMDGVFIKGDQKFLLLILWAFIFYIDALSYVENEIALWTSIVPDDKPFLHAV